MKHFFTLLSLITITCLSAQTKFEKGYYISTNGTKSEGYIKNSDWKNTPNLIEFKSNLNENSVEINTSLIKEFEIENKLKYKRFNVDIEKSSVTSGQLSNNSKTPNFNKENLLLKVLIEGKASLYQFNESGIEKFFYSTDKKDIEQLIFLSYIADAEDVNSLKVQGIDYIIENSTILYNRTYRKQLNENVNCGNSRDEISKLGYSKTNLVNFFKKYNECENSEFKKFESGNKSTFRLKASLISNLNSLNLKFNNNDYYETNFGTSIDFGFGFEAEIILPFNNNKWSVILEPSYNIYKNSDHLTYTFYTTTLEQDVNVEYNYIQIPIGIRHYFYINEKASIFINAAYNAKLSVKSNGIKYEVVTDNNLEIFPSLNNVAFGLGFNYKKYSIETRVFSNTQILKGSSENKFADYKNISLNLRYQFL
ncbi:hypothetical protein [Flavobacterium lacisediminis]|uniref:Outer membrane protein beta-barrel domain-containing protein n=1 Tax=Flavobacterium lacisediminis TaxID=2989705 RepID=A0ABT3EJR0_9FLAO|nr:hypothetical protein [Flavobacterium lacisediminis]MCW1148811.1 hypothetical protein [Flavobacterium lacisediminis]